MTSVNDGARAGRWHLSPVLAAVVGGLLCGTGMLILFRHRASLGGLDTLVLYLQERLGWRAARCRCCWTA